MSDESQTRPAGELRERTKAFALRVIRLCAALGDHGIAGTISRQLVRCGTSVGAQYREACRGRSTAEFVSKIQSATQELDETCYWLELLVEAEIMPDGRMRELMREADELMAMLVSSAKTAKRHGGRPPAPET